MAHPTMVPPPGQCVSTYFDATPDPGIPAGFIDAMAVRKDVFVKEQNCPLDEEIDSDDFKSYHWVVYASTRKRSGAKPAETDPLSPPPSDSVPDPVANGSNGAPADSSLSNSTTHLAPTDVQPHASLDELSARMDLGGQVPAGTIRLVPPPHNAHPAPGSRDGVGGSDVSAQRVLGGDVPTSHHDGLEPYVKIGRMATAKPFRGLGLARLMVSAALDWAATHKDEVEEAIVPKDPVEKEKLLLGPAGAREWKGLVMAHSQVGAKTFYESMGFVEDKELGRWWEAGIEHVAMWKRVVPK